ncbi:virulence factor SrfB [Proteus sp. TJ1640]|uniref:virulence factor SrfB n=1 Tax=Proteus sp. TJ1640 TaxID=2050968 RepID=UPI000D6882CA|nr:virulence factor SrfB [Proteus sp. TJ1640]
MLAPLTDYKDKITLIRDSNIQFLDFGFTLPQRKEYGEFVKKGENGPLMRLIYNERDDNYLYPAPKNQPQTPREAEFSFSLEESLNLLNDTWLPVPFFRFNPPRSFSQGPDNWVRMMFHQLPEPDEDGHTHRIVVAFDTRIEPNRTNTAYLAPNEEDVRSGVAFALAYLGYEVENFLETPWIDGWLKEVFSERALAVTKMYHDELDEALKEFQHQAHYLNLLNILGEKLHLPEIKINESKPQEPAIEVDLILDVGNSRTCGILIEDHINDNKGLTQLYEMTLRDLSHPYQIYNEPFESRVEFAQAEFGKQDFSVNSGRNNAFMWPTIGRVGPEANRMAAQRLGTEGSTGISSPKRYLWDDSPYSPGWRFSRSFGQTDREPLATAVPMTYLLNDHGEPLFRLEPDERMPVFTPNYTRSSLMTMMLTEVLAQALTQMNSPAQRLKMSHASAPRQLRNIILTIPPAMPKPERAIFETCMENALGLIWKAMNWDPTDEKLRFDGKDEQCRIPMPNIHVKWDEATCGQLVYLYNETQIKFGERTEAFFASQVREDNRALTGDSTLKIASIDIGGGTTDLVITRYKLDTGIGSNVKIIPTQLFREGFKIAGDDILLDIIQICVLPALRTALTDAGISDADALMSSLFGSEGLDAGQQVLRQQLTLQIFNPIGLRILSQYENFDPLVPHEGINSTFGELLDVQPTEHVRRYIDDAANKELGGGDSFSILNVPVQINFTQLHAEFISGERINITRSLKALCEVLYYYSCDVLLLTGRPSRLPGIQALLKVLQPVPPSRILPLHGYKTGGWYPFNKKGRIDDPKSTAAVGAMLCLMAENARLLNFYFSTGNFKTYSTVRYLGMLDNNNTISDNDVYYRDIQDKFEPDPDTYFEVRGGIRLGFRQLDNARWPASPLYTLRIKNPKLAQQLSQEDSVLHIKLGEERGASSHNNDNKSEKLRIEEMELINGKGGVNKNGLSFKLNTLADSGIGETSYWLDSGSVLGK